MVRQQIRIASTATRVPQYALFHAQCIVAPTILVAPCAFKGTLGPREVTEALSAGIRRALPEAAVLQCPVSDGGDGLLERSLFQQEAVKRGILLLVTHNMTAAHDAQAIEQTLEVYATVLKTLSNWLSDADPARYLEGPMIQPVFRVR